MNQSNKTSPVLYSASELRQRDQLREVNQQQVLGKKQLQKSFSDIRDVDDFRQALMQEPSELLDFSGKCSNSNHTSSHADSRLDTHSNSGDQDGEQKSKGRWVTESAVEKPLSGNSPQAIKSSPGADGLLHEMGGLDREWQQFELETSTVGVLRFSVKRDEHGVCLRLTAQDGTVEQVLQAHWETIALDLSKALGLNVRFVGSAHG